MICKTNCKNRRRKWIAFVLLLAVISSILCACGAQPGETSAAQPAETIEFRYGLQEYASYFSGFGKMEDEEFIKYADEIVDGTLYVTNDLQGYPYELGKIDWDVSYTESPNTFQLYLQGLSCLQILGQAYRLNGNVEYLRVGEKILEEWRAYQKTPASSENPMCWDDHGAVVRAESILYFMICCENTELDTSGFRQEIYDLLTDHAAFLADEKNYIESHNHGIMQDYALLHIAYYIDAPESEEWIQLAKGRLKEQKEYAFNSEMVHVENTPNYAILVITLFYQAHQFLSNMKDADAEEFISGIHWAADFVAWSYLPSGAPASIGDSNRPEQMRKMVYSYSDRLRFASSMGEVDTMSEEEKKETTKYYPDAGYFFYRENWNAENSADATWKMFKAGYSSQTHKHADDLSFMLYSKGYEIFTDPGFFNYTAGSPYRDYLTSSSAHNTITVDEKRYSISAENSSKAGMLSCTSTDKLDSVAAFSDMYYGVEIDRNFYSSGDLTVLYDNIVSEEEHDYAQLFQLGEDIHVSHASSPEGDLLMEIGDTGFRVRIRQALPAGLEMISGKETVPRYGHICRQMGEVINSQTLKYSKSGTNADFITMITIEDGDGMVRLKDGSRVHYSEIIYDEARHTVSLGDEKIPLQARTRFYPEADVQLDSSGILQLSAAAYEDCEYAWYLVDAETAKPFYKSDYSAETGLAYDISNQEADVFVKLYVRSKAVPQKKSALVAALVFDGPGRFHLDEGEKYPYLNLVYRGHRWEKLAENKYRFSIDYDYSWNTRQTWYVYRNYAFLEMIGTEDERQFEYTFTEPGEYTIHYYLKTPNGDNEYWNFESIKICG